MEHLQIRPRRSSTPTGVSRQTDRQTDEWDTLFYPIRRSVVNLVEHLRIRLSVIHTCRWLPATLRFQGPYPVRRIDVVLITLVRILSIADV